MEHLRTALSEHCPLRGRAEEGLLRGVAKSDASNRPETTKTEELPTPSAPSASTVSRRALCHRRNGTQPSSYITPASLDSVFIIDALGHLTCQVLSINDGAREDCAASTA